MALSMATRNKRITAQYASGATTTQLGAKYGLHFSRISQIVRAEGGTVRGTGARPNLKRRTEVVALRKAGHTYAAIATKLGCTPANVAYIAKSASA